MSSEADLDVVRRALEAFDLERPEAFYALCDPEHVEIVPLRAAIEDTVYRGPDAPQRFVEGVREAWVWLRFGDHEVRPAGDRVLVLAQARARSRDAGVDLEFDLGGVFGLRNGRIAYIHTYMNPDDAVAAVERGEP